jgi:hypothetical protein
MCGSFIIILINHPQENARQPTNIIMFRLIKASPMSLIHREETGVLKL